MRDLESQGPPHECKRKLASVRRGEACLGMFAQWPVGLSGLGVSQIRDIVAKGAGKLESMTSPGTFSKLVPKNGLGVCPAPPCLCHFSCLPSVAQKVVTLRKQQQLLAACKSLPSSPSHSAASTPVAGQVSWDLRAHRSMKGAVSQNRARVAKRLQYLVMVVGQRQN